MSNDYTFWHMLSDIIFNGNKVSGGSNDRNDDNYSCTGEYDNDDPSSGTSGEFDPSDAAGEAFRSVFGDDND